MAKQAKHCNHVLANGVLCGARPLRDNDFCYWHHKARTNLRARTTTSDTTSSGIVLPLLEDANGIQMALQQITQAVLDGRLDNRRAGLLLYSLQLAMMNVKNVQTDPTASSESTATSPHSAKKNPAASTTRSTAIPVSTTAIHAPSPNAPTASSRNRPTPRPRSQRPSRKWKHALVAHMCTMLSAQM